MSNIKIIAFDADDTLWVNEPIFTKTQDRCKALLKKYVQADELEEKLYETERKNLRLFGYGVKGFTLSMIETAIQLSNGAISGQEIQQIINLGKEMIQHPVEVLPGVEQTLQKLQDDYELMVITKGDLFDQESKIARSGLSEYFGRVEIVSEKNESTYKEVLNRNAIDVQHFLMIGNSLKSDVLPICNIGGKAIHIPFHTTWVHETVSEHHIGGVEYDELSAIAQLPGYLTAL